MANDTENEGTYLLGAERNNTNNKPTPSRFVGATSEQQLVGEMEDDEGPPWFNEYLRPVMAEFVAVMLFVFVGTMSVVSGQTIVIGSAHGFMIALLVANTGPISGGHVNPAVTLGVCIGGGVTPLKAVLYVLLQLLGGIIGSALTLACLSFNVVENGTSMTKFEAINGGGHALGPGVTPGMGFAAEVGLTVVLVFTVLMTAVNTDGKNVIHPLCIGLAVLADILAGAPISGASMNPARSFGPAVVLSMAGSSKLWTDHWVYWIGPACGALLASLSFRFLFATPNKRWVYKSD